MDRFGSNLEMGGRGSVLIGTVVVPKIYSTLQNKVVKKADRVIIIAWPDQLVP